MDFAKPTSHEEIGATEQQPMYQNGFSHSICSTNQHCHLQLHIFRAVLAKPQPLPAQLWMKQDSHFKTSTLAQPLAHH